MAERCDRELSWFFSLYMCVLLESFTTNVFIYQLYCKRIENNWKKNTEKKMLIISPGKTEKEESRRQRLAHDRKLFGEEDMAQAGRYVSNMKTGT